MIQLFKKVFVSFLVVLMVVPAMAEKELGIFNSLSVGAGVSTTGIDVTLAAPITSHFAVRGGISFLPNFKFHAVMDAYVASQGGRQTYPIELEGALKRTTASLLVNYYPFKAKTFFLTAGGYFGGSSLVGISGYSEKIAAEAGDVGITIGDQVIPVGKDGRVAGGIQVAGFRPYVGLGFGHAVPKNRVGVLFELGVQFHGTPELYTDYGTLDVATIMNDDDHDAFNKIIDKLSVYPLMKVHVFFRTF